MRFQNPSEYTSGVMRHTKSMTNGLTDKGILHEL